MQANSAEENQSPLYMACPFLGSADDRNTRAIFPSESSHCFSDNDAASIPIHLEHQAQFCLNGNHVNCPRFLGIDSAPLIIAQPETQPRKWGKRTRALYAVAMVALIALVCFASWRVFNTAQTANADAENAAAVVSAETASESFDLVTPDDDSAAADGATERVDDVDDASAESESATATDDASEAGDAAADAVDESDASPDDTPEGAGASKDNGPDSNDADDADAASDGTDSGDSAEVPAAATPDATTESDSAANGNSDTATEEVAKPTPDPAIPLILPPAPEPDDAAVEAESAEGSATDETPAGQPASDEAAVDQDVDADADVPAESDTGAEADEAVVEAAEDDVTRFTLAFPGGNLRTGPGTGNPIITVVPQGSEVEVLGRTPGYWFYVRLDNGVEGWLAYSVFQSPDADEAAAVPVFRQ